MTGFPLIIAFVVAVILMIIAISKFKIHPFISIMGISLILGLVAGIPIVDTTLEDGTTVSGIASVIGAGFSGTFSSIGIFLQHRYRHHPGRTDRFCSGSDGRCPEAG